MSIRTRVHLLVFVAFPVGFFTLGILGMTVHLVFAFLALAYFISIEVLALGIRCPNCNTQVIMQTYLLSHYVGKRCRCCGYDLTRRDTARG